MAGWDPVFEYEGKTYAEMDKEEKVSLFLFVFSSLFLSVEKQASYSAILFGKKHMSNNNCLLL